MQEDIATRIREQIADADVDVQVDGNRALITVVSSAFAPMSRVQKQQAVYACIREFIENGSLHAVTIRASAPDG
jgi:acid stress-induced BolA-like protein IbaG/YrbA